MADSCYLLSFDCANKSLGYTYARIYNPIQYCIDLINPCLKKSVGVPSDWIEILSCGVLDLLPNMKLKNTNPIFRAQMLYNRITKLIEDIKLDDNAIILIETQPSFNIKSSYVSYQLLMIFIKYDTRLVPSSQKNKMYIGNLKLADFRQKYASNYAANKEHSKAMFKVFRETHNVEWMIDGIAKRNIDDLADSCMQILAYIPFLYPL